MLKKISIVLVVLLTLLLAELFVVQKKVENYLSIPRVDKTMLFTVKAGSNFSRLGSRLAEQSLVDDLNWWKVTAKLHPELTKIKSGT